MSDTEINEAIAKACGWRWDVNDKKETYWFHPNKPFLSFTKPPDFCSDLNACHEAEKVLWTDQIPKYCKFLWEAMADSPEANIGTIHATARQRAEAFLRTKGLWKEEAA